MDNEAKAFVERLWSSEGGIEKESEEEGQLITSNYFHVGGRHKVVPLVGSTTMISGNWLFLRCLGFISREKSHIFLSSCAFFQRPIGTISPIFLLGKLFLTALIAGIRSPSAVTIITVSKTFSIAPWNNLIAMLTSVCFSSWLLYICPQSLHLLSRHLNFPSTTSTPFHSNALRRFLCRSKRLAVPQLV